MCHHDPDVPQDVALRDAQLGLWSRPGELVPVGDWDVIVERATEHRVVSARLQHLSTA